MAPLTRAVGSLHLAAQREPTGLPERVLNTISEARAPSTRRLYALKWSVFSTWCLNRGENPSASELAVVLSFLQELLDKGHSHSTLKVFVAAIAAFHAPIAGQSVGRDNSVVRFLFCYQQFFIFFHTQHNIQNKTKQNSRHILNISRFNQKGGREGRTTRTQKLLL